MKLKIVLIFIIVLMNLLSKGQLQPEIYRFDSTAYYHCSLFQNYFAYNNKKKADSIKTNRIKEIKEYKLKDDTCIYMNYVQTKYLDNKLNYYRSTKYFDNIKLDYYCTTKYDANGFEINYIDCNNKGYEIERDKNKIVCHNFIGNINNIISKEYVFIDSLGNIENYTKTTNQDTFMCEYYYSMIDIHYDKFSWVSLKNERIYTRTKFLPEKIKKNDSTPDFFFEYKFISHYRLNINEKYISKSDTILNTSFFHGGISKYWYKKIMYFEDTDEIITVFSDRKKHKQSPEDYGSFIILDNTIQFNDTSFNDINYYHKIDCTSLDYIYRYYNHKLKEIFFFTNKNDNKKLYFIYTYLYNDNAEIEYLIKLVPDYSGGYIYKCTEITKYEYKYYD